MNRDLLKFSSHYYLLLSSYKNLMERIMKETREEIAKKGPSKSLDELYESAQLAHQAIHEVLFFANAYMSEDRLLMTTYLKLLLSNFLPSLSVMQLE